MHILLVDDDPEALLITRRLLERRGFTVTPLNSPFGVTKHVAGLMGQRPDVVVLDYMMPGLSGERLLEMWSQDVGTASVPVVLYSAAAADVLAPAARRHPRCVVVQKGHGTQVLVDAINGLLSRGL